ncbi:MAG: T9SS type A sorting domain-containing protein, partial [Candidatus Cloacimonetes bacterium]|nr:T9SS type A sorting domain-containing protein [Candidatus Cloacimonadota bacterium]
TTLSYQDNDLANANYHYTIVAVFGTHLSNPADAGIAHVEVIYPPIAPQVLVYDNNVTFSWTAVADAGFLMNYRIFRSGSQIAEQNNLSYTDNSLGNGTYSYTVQAVYQAGSSAQTAPVVAEVMLAYPPRNLSYGGPGSVIYLSWQAPVDMGGFSEYRISRNGTFLGATTSTAFADITVPNGQHTYQVAAVYANSQSAAAEISFTNIIAYPVQNLSHSVEGSSISLDWDAPMDTYGLEQYQVINGSGTVLATIDISQTSCNLDYMANGLWRIWIRTVYAGGVMLPMQEFTWINVLMPYYVEGFVLEAVSDSSLVHLSWNDPSDTGGLTSFRITRNGNQIAELTEGNSYTDTSVPNGAYVYSISSVYGDLVSEPITNTCTIHHPIPAANVTAVADSGAFSITWEAPAALSLPDYYEVFFLVDGQQQAPASWTYVARVDSLIAVTDEAHGGLNTGDFLWAVFAMWDSGDGLPAFSNILHVEPIVPPIPEVTKLKGNFPNPFNPHTVIKFDLHQNSPVKLLIYNSRGQLVRTLFSGTMYAGEQQLTFDGKDDNGRLLGSGLYIYRLQTKGYTKTRKMMLMK